MLDSSSLCSFVQEPDTDLEVVLEKKGNMDEAHIDQVPSAFPSLRVTSPLLLGHKIPVSKAPWTPGPPGWLVCHTCSGRERCPFPLHAGRPRHCHCWLGGHLVIQNPRLRLSSP